LKKTFGFGLSALIDLSSQKRFYLTHYVLCLIPIFRSGNLELKTLSSALATSFADPIHLLCGIPEKEMN